MRFSNTKSSMLNFRNSSIINEGSIMVVILCHLVIAIMIIKSTDKLSTAPPYKLLSMESLIFHYHDFIQSIAIVKKDIKNEYNTMINN